MLCTENSMSRWGTVITFLKGYTYHSNTGFTRLYKHLLKQNEILHWYHWQELPQVSFLSRLKFCHNKSMLATTKLLFQQNYVCRDKIFLSQQTQKFCHDKHTFVTTKNEFCCNKHVFIATKIFLSRQSFGCNKIMFVATKYVFCHDKHVFVATKLLLWQKLYLWQLPPMIHWFINKIDTNTANMKNCDSAWSAVSMGVQGH